MLVLWRVEEEVVRVQLWEPPCIVCTCYHLKRKQIAHGTSLESGFSFPRVQFRKNRANNRALVPCAGAFTFFCFLSLTFALCGKNCHVPDQVTEPPTTGRDQFIVCTVEALDVWPC